jgi:hypothetical protein
MQISNDGGFTGAAWQPFTTRPNWTITAFGASTLPRLVYIRLKTADGSISVPFNDDIIYDPVAPFGSLRVAYDAGSPAHVVAYLSAQDPDNLSGVEVMRVGVSADLAQAEWEPYSTSKTLELSAAEAQDGRFYAQFRDRAGNVSATSCARVNGQPCASFGLFLPMFMR